MSEEKKPTKQPTIIKAFYGLKIKAGSGGFDPRNVAIAEKRLAQSTHLFPAVASPDIALIEEAIRMIESQSQVKGMQAEVLRRITAASVELKSHSTMFQFPLVGSVAESMLNFCLRLKKLTPVARDVIELHVNTLKIAINEGARAITPKDRETLLHDLDKATHKVLQEQV